MEEVSINVCYMEEDCVWDGDHGAGADFGCRSFDVVWCVDLRRTWIFVSYRVAVAQCRVWASLSRVSHYNASIT